MKVEVADYLRMAEKTGTILFFDLETMGLTADYGKILLYSRCWGPNGDVKTTVGEGNILRAMRSDFEKADLLVGYNSRLFDVQFANTRLLEQGREPLPRKHHLDMYFALKGKLRTTGKSMGVVGSLLGAAESKMKIPAKAWRCQNIPLLTKRCESDVKLLRQVYKKTKHLIYTITV